MTFLRSYIWITCLIIATSCIDELAVPIEEGLEILVVEGYISTQPGPHRLRLSRSAKYGNIFAGTIRPVQEALVTISDDLGNRIELREGFSGFYFTPDLFQARVGLSYTLHIETEKSEYISTPQKVLPGVAIDSIQIEYAKRPLESDVVFDHGVDVYVTFRDPVGIGNYYLWRNQGTYKVFTYPPPGVHCCAICYVDENDADPLPQPWSDGAQDGDQITRRVAFIRDDGARYDEKYELKLSQLSINQEAYTFFELIAEQISISGSIFDPPPAPVRGNIIDLNNPEAQTVGFFVAADEKVQNMFIPRELLQQRGPDFRFGDDCRKLPRSSTERPEHWGQ